MSVGNATTITTTRTGLQKGIEIGRQQRVKLGEWENKLSIAKNMLEKRLDVALIAEVTGLTIEQINTIMV